MRNIRSTVRRLVLVMLVCGAVLVGLGGTASAHAQLEGSDPPPNSVVSKAPQQVVLTFDEQVEVASNAIQIYDDHLQRADDSTVARVAKDGNRIQVGLRPNSRAGTYTVSWHVSSADTHPVSGTFQFSIGAPSLVTGKIPDIGRNDSAGFLLGVMRTLGYAGLVLGPGLLLVTLALWPAGVALGRTRVTLYCGLALLGVSTLGSMLLQGVWASGRPLSAMWSAPASLDTHSHKFDTLYALRFYLLVAFGVLVAASVSAQARSAVRAAHFAQRGLPGDRPPAASAQRRPAPSAQRSAPATAKPAPSAQRTASTSKKSGTAGSAKSAVQTYSEASVGRLGNWLIFGAVASGSLALMLTWSLAGHAAAGLQPPLAVAADMLHLMAMAIWLGGLVLLNVSLRPAERVAELAAVLPRFSRLAFGCVAVLVATGSYQTWRDVGSFDALFATTFGRLLMVKLGVVVVILALGNLARVWVQRHLTGRRRSWRRPRLIAAPVTAHAADAAALERSAAAGSDATPAGTALRYGPADLRRLRRGLTGEVAIALAVLAITAALVVSVPSRQIYVRPFRQTALGGQLQLAVRVDAPRVGDTVVHLYARTPGGQPIPITEIRGSLSNATAGLGPLPLRLANPTGASATGKEDIGLTFPKSGDWTLHLTVQTSALDATAFDFRVPVS